MKLSGKIAIVTGAGRGIGKGIAQRLAQEGAAVSVNYFHSSAGALETVEGIRKAGGRAIAIHADVSDVAQAAELVRQTVAEFGQLDILVNNSGIDPACPFLDVSEELFHSVINTNLKGVYFCSQHAAREMRKSGTGRIINIGSVHSHASMPGFSVYAASKGAIDALTRQLALDLSPFGITVNGIVPGAVEVEKFVADPCYDREGINREIPLGRVGLPRDISGAVVFLASEDAAWMTGQVIVIDGGTLSRLYLYAGRPIPSGKSAETEGEPL
jgi:NAD(P)-dependent dehydrogenase (short-subunit alcohol dehydrogenase family)